MQEVAELGEEHLVLHRLIEEKGGENTRSDINGSNRTKVRKVS